MVSHASADLVGSALLEQNRKHMGSRTLSLKEQFLGVVPGSMCRTPDLRGMMHPVRARVAGDLASHHREESRHQTIIDPRNTRPVEPNQTKIDEFILMCEVVM